MKHGTGTSDVELISVSSSAIRLLIDEKAYDLPFSAFPWFRDATITQISAIERPAPDHLRWPALDVDLSLDSIQRPQDYPLVAR